MGGACNVVPLGVVNVFGFPGKVGERGKEGKKRRRKGQQGQRTQGVGGVGGVSDPGGRGRPIDSSAKRAREHSKK